MPSTNPNPSHYPHELVHQFPVKPKSKHHHGNLYITNHLLIEQAFNIFIWKKNI